MNDVINRKDAIGAILSVGHIAELSDGDAVIRVSAVNYVLRNLPPTQPEPKEGRWINGKCDLCGEHAPFWCMASTYHESNYCPNCGAKMQGEQT